MNGDKWSTLAQKARGRKQRVQLLVLVCDFGDRGAPLYFWYLRPRLSVTRARKYEDCAHSSLMPINDILGNNSLLHPPRRRAGKTGRTLKNEPDSGQKKKRSVLVSPAPDNSTCGVACASRGISKPPQKSMSWAAPRFFQAGTFGVLAQCMHLLYPKFCTTPAPIWDAAKTAISGYK